ncbi:hypothetical protein HPC49_13800 [Pyxidicoccus fallax]|uniref:Lipoprotein n=1 Tax=Pyxidicoccus fallax TaxID=394095 RepID=A0A848LLV7_9BACT|nr:hypothetical protein [Pyxidicoccus fallax]NMO18726.1 hypothetical protein [Pyxidicoccus fallax]NPC79307.1 hypothetical protein [Pyxidicoccus fallax]
MRSPFRVSHPSAAPLLVLAVLAWSGGALAGAPGSSFRVWSAPDLIAVTWEASGTQPALSLYRRPLDPSTDLPLCMTSLFQGGAQDCFVPYKDCTLNLQVSRAGGGMTLTLRKAEGPDCPSDLPAEWRLKSTPDILALLRADFVSWVRNPGSRLRVGEGPGRGRSASELLQPLPDAELLRLFDTVAPFLSEHRTEPRSRMWQLTSAAASALDACGTIDQAECIRGYLERRYPRPTGSARPADPSPQDLGDPAPLSASELAVPGEQASGMTGVWAWPEIDLNYVNTVSARTENGRLHMTFMFQQIRDSGGLREQASFPSVDCVGAHVRQGWSRLECGDRGAVKVRLQGARLVVRALSLRMSSEEPRLGLETEFRRVDSLALEAAFLRYPLEPWGANSYPQDIENDLKDELGSWMETTIPQKVRASLRARKEVPETMSASRAFNLLSFTLANLMKRCPAQDPGRKACIERELPEAIRDAHARVGPADGTRAGAPGKKQDGQ